MTVTVQDLFAIMVISGGIALVAMIVRVVLRMVIDDLKGKHEYEDDEHTQGLTPPWLRKKK